MSKLTAQQQWAQKYYSNYENYLIQLRANAGPFIVSPTGIEAELYYLATAILEDGGLKNATN